MKAVNSSQDSDASHRYREPLTGPAMAVPIPEERAMHWWWVRLSQWKALEMVPRRQKLNAVAPCSTHKRLWGNWAWGGTPGGTCAFQIHRCQRMLWVVAFTICIHHLSMYISLFAQTIKIHATATGFSREIRRMHSGRFYHWIEASANAGLFVNRQSQSKACVVLCSHPWGKDQ